MAGIDKIYGTERQLFELRGWLQKKDSELLDYVADPDDKWYIKHDDETTEFSIANFPEDVDKWLYKHCPLKFVTERIHEQYGGDPTKP